MQFALIQYAFSVLTNKTILEQIARTANIDIAITAFMPIIPPVFIKPAVFNRMARLEPRDERYYIPSDDLFLIGSAEHTIGPIHMDQIIEEKDLPKRYVGYSTAFRRRQGLMEKIQKAYCECINLIRSKWKPSVYQNVQWWNKILLLQFKNI